MSQVSYLDIGDHLLYHNFAAETQKVVERSDLPFNPALVQ